MSRTRSLVGPRRPVVFRLALGGLLLAASFGGPPAAAGAPLRSPVERAAVAVTTLGDLVVPADALGPNWTAVDQQEPGDGVIRASFADASDYAVPRQATFWVRVASSRDELQPPIAVARNQTGSPTLVATLVDLGDTPDAMKVVSTSPDQSATTVGFSFVVDRANAFVAVQGAPEEQADLDAQALTFAGLQVERLRGGLPEVAPSPAPTTAPTFAPALPTATLAPSAPPAVVQGLYRGDARSIGLMASDLGSGWFLDSEEMSSNGNHYFAAFVRGSYQNANALLIQAIDVTPSRADAERSWWEATGAVTSRLGGSWRTTTSTRKWGDATMAEIDTDTGLVIVSVRLANVLVSVVSLDIPWANDAMDTTIKRLQARLS